MRKKKKNALGRKKSLPPAKGAQGKRNANEKAQNGENLRSATAQEKQALRRAVGGVPPADAFDGIPRRKPPNLAGPANTLSAQRNKVEQKTDNGPKVLVLPTAQPKKEEAPPKKKSKKRSVPPAKRRRRRRILAVSFIALLVGVAVWLTVTMLFKIESFEIEGESPYTLQQVVAVFGRSEGEGMYGFSESAAEQRIQTSLPYIETVEIHRRLPSTIQFRVSIATEMYYMEWGGGYAVLSDKLKVLKTQEEPPQGLVLLKGLTNMSVVVGEQLSVSQEVVVSIPTVNDDTSVQDSSVSAASTPEASSVSAVSDVSTQNASQLQGEDASSGDVAQTSDELQPTAPSSSDAQQSSSSADNTEPTAVDAGQDTLQNADDAQMGDDTADASNGASSEASSEAQSVSMPVLTTNSQSTQPDAPMQTVQEIAQESFQTMQTLLQLLEDEQLNELSWVDVSNPLDIMFSWEGRVTVRLGADTGFEEKVETAAVLLTSTTQDLIGPQDEGVLDMGLYLSSGNAVFTPS